MTPGKIMEETSGLSYVPVWSAVARIICNSTYRGWCEYTGGEVWYGGREFVAPTEAGLWSYGIVVSLYPAVDFLTPYFARRSTVASSMPSGKTSGSCMTVASYLTSYPGDRVGKYADTDLWPSVEYPI